MTRPERASRADRQDHRLLTHRAVRLVAARRSARPAARRPVHGGVGVPAAVRRLVRRRPRRRRTRRERRPAWPGTRARLRTPARPRRGRGPGASRGRGCHRCEAVSRERAFVVSRRGVRAGAAPGGCPGRAPGDGGPVAGGQDRVGGGARRVGQRIRGPSVERAANSFACCSGGRLPRVMRWGAWAKAAERVASFADQRARTVPWTAVAG